MSKSKEVFREKKTKPNKTQGQASRETVDLNAGYCHSGLLTLIFDQVLRESPGIETNCQTLPMN